MSVDVMLGLLREDAHESQKSPWTGVKPMCSLSSTLVSIGSAFMFRQVHPSVVPYKLHRQHEFMKPPQKADGTSIEERRARMMLESIVLMRLLVRM